MGYGKRNKPLITIDTQYGTGGTSQISKGIEILSADPTGADLWEGRIWINSTVETPIPTDTTAPIVTVSPSGGTYSSTQSATLSVNETATIYYTTDGSVPTTASAVYGSPIDITTTTTLKYYAIDTVGNSSAVQGVSYTIDTTAPVITVLPSVGIYANSQNVTLTSNETATIYYTIDGTTPTTSSSIYSSPITISATTTLKYFAIDAFGNSGVVQTATYTIDTVSPNSVTDLILGTITPTSILIGWTLSNSTDVANYEVAYSNDNGATYAVTSNLINASSTSYTITNLSPSTSYKIRVVAIDNVGNRSTDTIVNTSTLAPDTTAPIDVVNLVVSNVAETDATLTWTASTSNDVSSYYVYQGNVLLGNTTQTSYNVTGLTGGTPYSFTVKVKDTSNNMSTGASTNITTLVPDTTPPNEVVNLAASNVQATSLTLTWTDSTSSDIASYDVYNGTAFLGNTTSTTYNVVGLTKNTPYTFTVKAKDQKGNVSTGASVSVTTLSSLDRTSTGKIYYDDFERVSLSPWNLSGANGSIQTVGSTKMVNVTRDINVAGMVQTLSSYSRTAYISCQMKLVNTNSNGRVGLRNAAIDKGYYACYGGNSNKITLSQSTGETQLATYSLAVDTNLKTFCIKLSSANIELFINGLSMANTNNSLVTSFDTIQLLGSGDVVLDGAYFDNVAVCSSNIIKCNNMPTGYKLRVGGKSVAEVGGTASLDCSGLAFPQSLVEILDSSNNVILSITATNDVWAGDIYTL